MSRNITKIIAIVLALAVISPLAACGRKGAPEFPQGSEYPRKYPTE